MLNSKGMQLAILIMLMLIIKTFGLEEASFTAACDNKSVLQRLSKQHYVLLNWHTTRRQNRIFY